MGQQGKYLEHGLDMAAHFRTIIATRTGISLQSILRTSFFSKAWYSMASLGTSLSISRAEFSISRTLLSLSITEPIVERQKLKWALCVEQLVAIRVHQPVFWGRIHVVKGVNADHSRLQRTFIQVGAPHGMA